MKKYDVSKRFLKLAYDQLNPNLATFDGLEQALSNWYCFQYNVPPNDDKLMSMTLEELLILRQMHRLREEPNLSEELNPDAENYEEWLKREMGEDYQSPEEMIALAQAAEEEDLREVEAVKNQYPDKITTDFSVLGNDKD